MDSEGSCLYGDMRNLQVGQTDEREILHSLERGGGEEVGKARGRAFGET